MQRRVYPSMLQSSERRLKNRKGYVSCEVCASAVCLCNDGLFKVDRLAQQQANKAIARIARSWRE